MLLIDNGYIIRYVFYY